MASPIKPAGTLTGTVDLYKNAILLDETAIRSFPHLDGKRVILFVLTVDGDSGAVSDPPGEKVRFFPHRSWLSKAKKGDSVSIDSDRSA